MRPKFQRKSALIFLIIFIITISIYEKIIKLTVFINFMKMGGVVILSLLKIHSKEKISKSSLGETDTVVENTSFTK